MRRLLLACVAAVALTGMVACGENTTEPDPVETNLTFKLCAGSLNVPAWFAAQDGDGAWKQVTRSASGSFDFAVTSGRGGIATYTNADGLVVLYASLAELEAILPNCASSLRTVTGTVTGYTTADRVSLQMGNSGDLVEGSQTPPASWLIEGIDAGASDLVGVRFRVSGTTILEAIPDNVFIRRSVTGANTAAVDFTAPTESGAPLQRTVNVTNLVAAEQLGVYSFIGMGSTLANIAVYEAPEAVSSGQTTAPFYGLPASRLSTSESHMVQLEATRAPSTSSFERRVVTTVFTDPTDRSVTFGPALGTVTVSGSSRPSATYAIQAEYGNIFEAVFAQGSGSTSPLVLVRMTKSYIGNASQVVVAVPDLSGVTGFSSSWMLSPGASAEWAFQASNATLVNLNAKAHAFQSALRAATFTP